jgi:hypothetical protein
MVRLERGHGQMLAGQFASAGWRACRAQYPQKFVWARPGRAVEHALRGPPGDPVCLACPHLTTYSAVPEFCVTPTHKFFSGPLGAPIT